MFKKDSIKINNIYNLLIYTLILSISLYLANNAIANPTKIIKNVICKESNVFKNYLKNNQNENLAWLGISQDGSTITELYISKLTNSWTILETDTNGLSCATIGGKDSRPFN